MPPIGSSCTWWRPIYSHGTHIFEHCCLINYIQPLIIIFIFFSLHIRYCIAISFNMCSVEEIEKSHRRIKYHQHHPTNNIHFFIFIPYFTELESRMSQDCNHQLQNERDFPFNSMLILPSLILLRTKITQTFFAFKTLNFHQNIYTTNIEVERRVADSSYVFSGYYNLTSNILKLYNAHQKKLV